MLQRVDERTFRVGDRHDQALHAQSARSRLTDTELVGRRAAVQSEELRRGLKGRPAVCFRRAGTMSVHCVLHMGPPHIDGIGWSCCANFGVVGI